MIVPVRLLGWQLGLDQLRWALCRAAELGLHPWIGNIVGTDLRFCPRASFLSKLFCCIFWEPMFSVKCRHMQQSSTYHACLAAQARLGFGAAADGRGESGNQKGWSGCHRAQDQAGEEIGTGVIGPGAATLSKRDANSLVRLPTP